MSRKRNDQAEPTVEIKKLNRKEKLKAILKKAPKEKFLTESQEHHWSMMEQNEITLCIGPAGVGKSFVTMKKAIDLLFQDNKYEKIIIVRPAVEAEEKLGSLPGGVEEKLDPYIFPSYYLLDKIVGKDIRNVLKEEGYIEIMALAYMRGTNIDNAILIFEEAQNSTPSQMKLLLTRIGYNSKFFISGDLEQNDRYKDKRQTGLWDAKEKLKGVSRVGIFEYKPEDVVRNPIISEILKKYE